MKVHCGNYNKLILLKHTAQDMTRQKTAELQYEHEVMYINTEHKSGLIAIGNCKCIQSAVGYLPQVFKWFYKVCSVGNYG